MRRNFVHFGEHLETGLLILNELFGEDLVKHPKFFLTLFSEARLGGRIDGDEGAGSGADAE